MTTALEKTIEIIFLGTDQSDKAFQSFKGNVSELDGVLRSITGPLASVGNDILKLDTAMAGLAAGAIGYSILKFAEFEDVMLKVKGVIGASEEEYQKLLDITKELGATTRYTATEAAQGLEFLALAGFQVDEAISALPEVLQLAQASATNLGVAADIVTNIMAGYGIAVSDLGKSNDVLTATFTNSNTNLEQLGQAFKFVGPVAKALGLEIEETASILGILANAGYQAEMGGTALRNILLALVAPAGNFGKLAKELGVDTNELGIDLSDSANALKSLGVEVKDADGNLRPFAKIMDDLKAGLEKIPDSADQAAILIEIFGKRGGPQMAALLEQGSGAVTGLETKIRSLGGVTSEIAVEMESGMEGVARAIKSAFEAMAIELGSAVSNKIIPAAGSITDIFRTIASEIEKGSFSPLFELIGEFADKVEAVFSDIAKALPEALEGVDYSALTGSFESLIDIGERMFKAIFPEDIRNPEGLQAAIQKIVNAWATLNDITVGILQSWEPVANTIGKFIQQLSDGEGPLYNFAVQLGNIFGSAQVIEKFIDRFGLAGTVIANFFSLFGGTNKTTFATFGEMIGDVSEDALKWEDSVGGKTSAAISKFIGWLKPATAEASEFQKTLESVDGTDVEIGIILNQDIDNEINEVVKQIDEYDWLTDPITIGLIIDPEDKLAAEKEIDEIVVGYRENGEPIMMAVELSSERKERVKEEIEQLVTPKMMEIQLQGEIDKELARIQADAEILQTAFEWKAKLDIAEVEAGAKRVEAAFESVNTSIISTGETLVGLFDIMSGFEGSMQDKWLLRDAVEQELKLREQAFELQKQLVESEIQLNEARTEALERGDSLITVNGDGLQPHLEMIMWEVFQAIQIRANQEGLNELLLGA